MLAHDRSRHIISNFPHAASPALRRSNPHEYQVLTPDFVQHDLHAGRLCVLNCRLQNFECVSLR